MSYSIYSLDGEARERYLLKLKSICMDNCCPYLIPEDAWLNEPTSWPSLEWPEVYDYLINTPGIFTREAMKNRKSLEAHNYFTSGWVRTVLMYNIEKSNFVVLKAAVTPSQRTNEDPHIPWVAINTSTTSIANAHCSCMAGLCESCSHVAALLFKIEAAVRCGLTSRACTEEPCAWNNDFVKNVQPSRISEIKFYSDETVKKIKKRRCLNEEIRQQPSQGEQYAFFEELSKIESKPVVLHTHDSFYESFRPTVQPPERNKLPLNLRTLYDEKLVGHKDNTRKACENYLENCQISPSSIEYLYSQTTQQSECLLWHQMRAGRITASKFGQLLRTNINQPAPSIVKNICKESFPRKVCIPSLKWGIDHEKDAVESYMKLYSDHQDVKYEQCGLKLLSELSFIGASPDGIFSCSCHGKKLLEIKCPFSAKETVSVNEAKLEFLDENLVLKRTHNYYAQVQLQLHVFAEQSCDFIVWTPNWLYVNVVTRDDEFIQTSLETVRQIYARFILPELFTRELESDVVVEREKIFKCICGAAYDVNDGEIWIGCDSTSCINEWFHLSCVKLKRVPKKTWYCVSCRKKQKDKV